MCFSDLPAAVAAAGFPPSAGEGLFIGAAMTFLLLWSAWAMYSTWRGWATNNLDSATRSSLGPGEI
ncbi:TIGR03758 family integrating conjugative element protein [Pseudomonas aeruginosa]